jgi:hypothetical protein
MKKIQTICCLLVIIYSCNNKPETEQGTASVDRKKIEQLQWILGSWKNISDNSRLYERWAKDNDTSYSGESFMIVDKDTVFYEKISLQLKGDDLFYFPTVKNQNNGQQVSFKLISDNKGEFIFENKEHDFPQRVIYKNPQADSLYACIEGDEKGKFRKEEFGMSRDKN